MRVDLAAIGLAEGGDLLLRRALRVVAVGDTVEVIGTHRELPLHLRAWARMAAVEFAPPADGGAARLTRTVRFEAFPAERSGNAGLDGVAERPPPAWGLAGRSAKVELGGPSFNFPLIDKAQAAQEARHIEVFTRRALLRRGRLGLSTTGGQASLKTLVEEPDFALASLLLSVMGEGSFLVLLDFLRRHGPDPVTRQVCRLAAQDEARHVAFGLAHLRRHAGEDPALLPRLAAAMHRRHAELPQTAGFNARVFEGLTIMAAGGFAPREIAAGHARVMRLQADMDQAGRLGLRRLGFADKEAETLSQLHSRNFM